MFRLYICSVCQIVPQPSLREDGQCQLWGHQERLAMPTGQPSLNKDVTYFLSSTVRTYVLRWTGLGKQCRPILDCSRRSLIRVYIICSSVCCFNWMHFSGLKLEFSNFRIITAIFRVSHFYFQIFTVVIIWAASWQNKQNDCASSEDSDQPVHPPSLIRVFAVHSVGS